jgi:hypothetical protein
MLKIIIQPGEFADRFIGRAKITGYAGSKSGNIWTKQGQRFMLLVPLISNVVGSKAIHLRSMTADMKPSGMLLAGVISI